MTGPLDLTAAPPLFLYALVSFGLAPGLVLRLIVRIYPLENPRRAELLGELYARSWWERPFFVAQQLETAVCEGAPARARALRSRAGRSWRIMSSDMSGSRARVSGWVIQVVRGILLTSSATLLIWGSSPGWLTVVTRVTGVGGIILACGGAALERIVIRQERVVAYIDGYNLPAEERLRLRRELGCGDDEAPEDGRGRQ